MDKNSSEVDDIKKKPITWTDIMDEALIDALLNQQARGNRPNGTFSSTAYSEIVKELTGLFDIELTKGHVKNRLKTIKVHFNECYDLFKNGLSGFSWNETTKLFDAEPEVWKALIEAKPNAHKWRNTRFANYNKLLDLFAKDRATGSLAATAKERNRELKNNHVKNPLESINGIDYLVSQNEVTIENFETSNTEFGDAIPSEPIGPSNDTPSSKKKRKRSSIGNDSDIEMIEAVRSVAAALKEGNDIYEKAHKKEKAEEEIYAKLDEIGVEEDQIDGAYLFLTVHDDRMRQFLGCPIPRRKRLPELMMRDSRN